MGALGPGHATPSGNSNGSGVSHAGGPSSEAGTHSSATTASAHPHTGGGAGTGPRTAKACVNCSVKKRRCDGGQPECSVCSVLGIACSYNNNPLRRGPPKGFRADPETSARARLMRKLETTIRDLVAQLGKEQAAREVYRISLERGIDELDMELAKPEPVDGDKRGTPSKEQSQRHSYDHDYDPERALKRARTDRGPSASSQSPLAAGASHPYPHLAHLAHEASMLRAPDLPHHSGSRSALPYVVKSQEEDDDFLGVNERGDLMHRGSSSGISLLNRTHAQIQQHTPHRGGLGQGPGYDRTSSLSAAGPSSNRTFLPPISTLHPAVLDPIPAHSALGAGGTVPLPMATAFRSGHTPHTSSAGPSALASPASHPALAMHMHSARSSPVPFDEQGRAAFAASQARPMSTDGIRARSPQSRSRPRWQDRFSADSDGERTHGDALGSLRAQEGMSDKPNEDLPRVKLTQEESSLLFKYYYSNFHPFWPVLFKPALDTIPTEELPKRIDEVLLYAIWLTGSAVMPMTKDPTLGLAHPSDGRREEEDSRLSPSDSSTTPARSTLRRLHALAPTLYACAEARLFASRLRPTVSTIQALFLLSLYSHGSGELSRAWVYSGLACAMLMDLGLHRWPIHRIELLHESAERETRTRLIWCVYILDKLLSAEMGRPVMLRAVDCDAPFLSELEADELEPWSGSAVANSSTTSAQADTIRYIHAPSCLNWGIRLFSIVEKILSNVHAFRRKAQLRHNAHAQAILIEIDRELNRWKAALPDWLSLERLEATRKAAEVKRRAEGTEPLGKDGSTPSSLDEGSSPLPSFFALHLWYFTSTLLLHRPFIPQDEGALLSEVLSNESHRKCTEAADTICDLIEASAIPIDRLSTDLAYCIFTAAVLQLFNARLADEKIAAGARRRLNLCRRWLRDLSETWPAASAHKQLLDGFSVVGQGAVEDTEVQLGLEAAAVAVASDAEAAAMVSALGADVGEAAIAQRDEIEKGQISTDGAMPPLSVDIGSGLQSLADSNTGPQSLEQHAGAQLRNVPPASTAAGSTSSTTSPSLLAMQGSGRLLMLNGSSPMSIPVSYVSRSPFFSMTTGKALPSLSTGGQFMLDGGGSALGTVPGPMTPQQRAQMEQYQAYLSSFQSRYANMGAGLGGGNVGSQTLTASSGDASMTPGNNAGPMRSVGAWMLPNTSMTALNSDYLAGLGKPAKTDDQTALQDVAQGRNQDPSSSAVKEIMTPMRMVNADVAAQQQTASRIKDALGAAPASESSLIGQDASMSTVTTALMSDAPVGLWDIENFFWNERSAGAASSASGFVSTGALPEPALSQVPAVAGLGAGLPGASETLSVPPDVEVSGRSTPSSVFGLPAPPALGSRSGMTTQAAGFGQGSTTTSAGTKTMMSSTPVGTVGKETSGTGAAASFQQLYSQVHQRKMSANTSSGASGQGGPSTSTVSAPMDSLSMLAAVTAAGAESGTLSSSSEGPSGMDATLGSDRLSSSSVSQTAMATPNTPTAMNNGSGSSSGGPVLNTAPTRRMTPLVGGSTPSAGFNIGNGTGTPSFLGLGLGMSSSGSSSSNGNGTGNGSGSGLLGGSSIISLSPFGFSMTPDPIVWDALAVLELPPSFAKV